ncbi:serine hydrolase domain-containing protein [Nonlabens ponticola]|uniref:Class A beta-lactamase-related serine hydrolase n=1 Tax=Nonlabens ponticola TaxID=2496866 RepID=A0A3S9N090_9FLAO|nr:serine hydrolase domain-containing protein [Nonlabens ponticola]AZQ44799.1 class A beta-lactamase-related serine hydrolase [Nonlabens ponticola]
MSKKRSLLVFRVLLLIGTAVSLYFVPWPIVMAWIQPLPDTVQEQIDQVHEYGFDGIIVYVDQKGKPPEFYTAGYKNTESKTPADAQSLFKIASVEKLFKALTVAKLSYRNHLSLDRSLAAYLPDLSKNVKNADEITLRMLVQHRSGIPDYTYTKDYWANPKNTVEENLNLITDQPAEFAPDTDYGYSNTNYLLLGRILDQTLGYNHFQYIENEILKPLQLNNIHTSINEVNIENVMSGYYVGYPHDLKTEDVGMLATAQDLGRFIRALNEGTVFTDSTEQQIYSSIYVYEHTGLIPGYQTIAKYHADMDTVVIQFTNTVDFEGYNWNMSEIMYSRILKILRQ